MKRVSKVWTDIQTRAWPGVSIVDGEVTNGLDYTGTPVVSCLYDNLGRIYGATANSDASTSSSYSCSYDANGRVTSVTRPSPVSPSSTVTSEYGYDNVGNLLYAKGGPESTYFTAKYDTLDRVTDVYLTGSSTLPNPLPSGAGDIRFVYEGASGLATDAWRGADKHVTYSYDTFGHLKTYKPTSGPFPGVNLWYDYNPLGQKKEVRILNSSGATVDSTTYDYYQNGALESINSDGSKVAGYSYDPVGLLAQIDFYSGGTATGAYDVYSYDASDPRDLLKTITMHYNDASGQPTSSVIDYTDGNGHPNVDKAGNQLTMDNLAGHWSYTYDHGGRVSSITPPNPVPEQGIGGSYGYNWLGHQLQQVEDEVKLSKFDIPTAHQVQGVWSRLIDIWEGRPWKRESRDNAGHRAGGHCTRKEPCLSGFECNFPEVHDSEFGITEEMGAGTHFEAFNKQLLSATVAVALLYLAGTKNRPPRCWRSR